MKTLSIETPIHGRVLVDDGDRGGNVLVGFHGYFENASIQMDRLRTLDLHGWTLVSIQALHRFYRGRSEEIVASWMTREDRDDMIRDNIAYVERAIAAAAAAPARLVTAGFSQGVAMAFRAAVRGRHKAAAVIAVGGDIPPELLKDDSAVFPPTLLLRGERDEWYTAEKANADAAALEARGTRVELVTYDAGHDWTADVSEAAAGFVKSL